MWLFFFLSLSVPPDKEHFTRTHFVCPRNVRASRRRRRRATAAAPCAAVGVLSVADTARSVPPIKGHGAAAAAVAASSAAAASADT